MNALKELVEQPVQENSRLVIKYKWIKGFFFRHNGIPWVVYLYVTVHGFRVQRFRAQRDLRQG